MARSRNRPTLRRGASKLFVSWLTIEKVKDETEAPFNANKYFPLIKEGLEIKNNKFIAQVLSGIQVGVFICVEVDLL